MTFMVLMATCLFASAQDIKVQAPELVSVDEQFNVTIVEVGPAERPEFFYYHHQRQAQQERSDEFYLCPHA